MTAIFARGFPDKAAVTRFVERAQQLLDTAAAGPAGSEMTVLIGHDGAIQLSSGSDWPLDSLARERGARAAYRVSRAHGRIRVEGRQGSETCVLEKVVVPALFQQLHQVSHLLGALPVGHQQRVRRVHDDQVMDAQ